MIKFLCLSVKKVITTKEQKHWKTFVEVELYKKVLNSAKIEPILSNYIKLI